jgi:hypothetical protein
MALESELLELEQQYWEAMKDLDADAAAALTDDACIVAGAQGVSRLDHEHLGAMMQGATWRITDVTITDASVERLTEDTAVVSYTVHEELVVDGQPVVLEAADTSTWVRRDGGWRCAVHTESITGDPFGRDRGPA